MYETSVDLGLVIGIVGAAVVCTVMFALFTTPNSEWRANAIERGYGLYCSSTGDFAWKDECDVK